MKIVFIITSLPVGGAQMVLYRLLSRLAPRFQTHVVCLAPIGELGWRIRALGVPVESLEMIAGIPNPLALARLASRLRELRPSVIHTWMYHADLLGGLAARLSMTNSPVFWCIRNSDLSAAQTKLSTRLVVKACALLSSWLPAKIVCCSREAQRIHEDAGYDACKFVFIPNGIDLTQFTPDDAVRISVRKDLGLGADTPIIGLIARTHPQKNHAGFVAAASHVHSKRPDVHFLLAGEGADHQNDSLILQIRESGLEKVFHLLGKREDVPRLMAALDLLVSASFGEAFPNVVAEAMASGVPVVATDVGDSAYIVGDTGRIVPAGDTKLLADAQIQLLGQSALEKYQLGKRARDRVRENFELGAMIRAYESLYDAEVERTDL